MAKRFDDGFEIPRHNHPRDQLLFAVEGVMRVTTDEQAWIVPPDRAVYIPGGVAHRVNMRGDVAMRTLYIARGAAAGLPLIPTGIVVSDLLRELILELLAEPIDYDEAGRGGHIAALIFDEIGRAEPQALVVPLPHDPRLARLCDALVADPACRKTLEEWSASVGASPRTLARLFEREVGLSFARWRQRLRFHHAMEAIVRGESIGLVARRSGYLSASAFTAAFRGVIGVSPIVIRHDT